MENIKIVNEVLNLNLDYGKLCSPVAIIEWSRNKKDVDYSEYEYYDFLKDEERQVCDILHLTPESYLRCLIKIVNTSREREFKKLRFGKKNAQDICNINVNKISQLYIYFKTINWI